MVSYQDVIYWIVYNDGVGDMLVFMSWVEVFDQVDGFVMVCFVVDVFNKDQVMVVVDVLCVCGFKKFCGFVVNFVK